MIAVIKTFLHTTDDLSYILESVSQHPMYFSNQEKQAFAYIYRVYKDTGQYPSESLFVQEFPDYKEPLQLNEIIAPEDLEQQYKILLSKRQRNYVAQQLMEEIGDVSEKGLTSRKFDKIRSIYLSQKSKEPIPLRMGLEGYQEIYQERKDRPLGLQTFVTAIDEKIGGLSYGTVNLVFGWVAHFKSLFALNIAYNNVIKNKYNVVFISLEVSREEIIFNLLSRHSFEDSFTQFSSIPHKKMKDGTLTPEEEEYLLNTVAPDLQEKLAGRLVILDESDISSYSFDEIYNLLDQADQAMDGGLDAVFWDHINLFKYSEDNSRLSVYDKINIYLSWIRSLSVDFKRLPDGKRKQLINVVVMQANREGWDRASKHEGKYRLTSLAEANEAERSAYRVISVYTNQNLKDASMAQVQLLKNRSGETFDDPIQVYANGRDYVFGDVVQGYNSVVSSDQVEDMFGDFGQF